MSKYIFFDNLVKKKEDFLYEKDFIRYKLAFYINRGINNIEGIRLELSKLFGEDEHIVNVSALKKELNECFNKKKSYYYLKNNEEPILEEIENIYNTNLNVFNVDLDTLTDKFISSFRIGKNYLEAFLYIITIKSMNYQNKKDFIKYQLFSFLQNYEKIKKIILNFKGSSILTGEESIDLIFNDEIILNLLKKARIKKVSNLLNLPSNSIYSLVFIDWIFVNKVFDFFSGDIYESFKDIALSFYNKLDDRSQRIFEYRIFHNSTCTLEMTGITEGVTRERIRQIETKIYKKAIDYIYSYHKNFQILFSILSKDNNYLLFEEIFKKFNENKLISEVILFFFRALECDYSYDKTYELLYKNNLEINEIIVEIKEKYGLSTIYAGNIDHFPSVVRKVLEYKYRKISERCYLEKPNTPYDLICQEIDSLFPNGYHISDENHFNLLVKTLKEKYDFEKPEMSMRSVSARLVDYGYFLVDYGTYKREIVHLPRRLLSKIISFLKKQKYPTSYFTLFEEFKDELLDIGIDNKNYLKGSLDPLLPEEYIPSRTSISVEGMDTSVFQGIRSFIYNSKGKYITVEQVSNKFKAVPRYTIADAFRHEEERGLILLSNKRYAYVERLNIRDSVIQKIKEIIEKNLSNSKVGFITSKKLYRLVRVIYPEIILKNDIFSFHMNLYSITQYYLSDLFYFKRPYISAVKTILSTNAVYENFVLTLNEFDNDTISTFAKTHGLRPIFSYLNFMIENSDNFVQVSENKMVKKEVLNITESQLNEIRQTLDFLINNNSLNLSNFKNYFLFSHINICSYKRNKYLLVGIIRSYLDEFYDIEYTDSTYNETEFIVTKEEQ